MQRHLITRLLDIGKIETQYLNEKKINIYHNDKFIKAAGFWNRNDMLYRRISGERVLDTLN